MTEPTTQPIGADSETSTVSFSGPPSSSALAVQGDRSPAAYVEADDYTGEAGAEDMIFPRLNIVQKVGALSEKFEGFFGGICLNQETMLSKLGGSLTVMALKMEKFFQLCPPTFGGTDAADLPRFNTASEVVQNGGSLSYEDKKEGNYYEPVGNILFLVREPDPCPPELEGVFLYDIPGVGNHLLCSFTGKGSAGWTAVAKKLANARQATGTIRGSLHRFTTVKKTFAGNTYAQGTLLPAGRPTEAHAAFIQKFAAVLKG